MVWLPVFGIFNMHADVDACNCTRGLYGHRKTKRVCTESWLWEKNHLPHQGLKPTSVLCLAFQLDAPSYLKYFFPLSLSSLLRRHAGKLFTNEAGQGWLMMYLTLLSHVHSGLCQRHHWCRLLGTKMAALTHSHRRVLHTGLLYVFFNSILVDTDKTPDASSVQFPFYLFLVYFIYWHCCQKPHHFLCLRVAREIPKMQ